MSDNTNTNDKPPPQLFNRFQAFGATLRQSAQDVAAKAAAQVNEINAKVVETAATLPLGQHQQQQPQQQQQQRTTTGSLVDGATPPSLHQPGHEPGTLEDVIPSNDATANSTATTGSTTTTTTTMAAAVENKDLVELLQKMNQKVKTLTAIRQQLTEQVTTLTNERQQIRTFVTEEILNESMISASDDGTTTNTAGSGSVTSEAAVLQQLQMAWRRQEEQHQLSIQMLQKEFQKLQLELQQQQKPPQQLNGENDNSNTAQQWVAEKQDLIQKHEEVVLQLKQQLHDAISSPSNDATTSAIPLSVQQDMEQRIKAEATQELQAFKEKVAVIRKAELQKVKTDTATLAKKIMETKLTDQKNIYEQQIQQLQLQNTTTNTTATDTAIAALEKQLELVQSDHVKQMEHSMVQHTQQVESLQLQLDTTAQELNVIRQQMDDRMVQDTKRMEGHVQEMDTLKRTVQNKDADISELRTDTSTMIVTKLQEQETALKEQFQKEKEQIRIDFQQKWRDATAANQTAAAQQLQLTIDTLTKESNMKIEQFQQEYNARKEQDSIQIKNEHKVLIQQAIETTTTEAKIEMDQLRTTFEGTIQSLQRQVDEFNTQYDIARKEVQASQLEIEKLKSSLPLAEQKLDTDTSRDIIQQQQKDRSDDHDIETMKNDIEQMAQTRDEALFKVIDLQNEIQRLSETKNTEIQTLQERYDTVTSELTTTAASLKANHALALNDLTNQLLEKEKELVQSKSVGTEISNDLSKQKSLYNDLEAQFNNLQNQGTMDADQTKSELNKIVAENHQLLIQLEEFSNVQADLTEQTKLLELKQKTLDDMTTLQQTTELSVLNLQSELLTVQKQLEKRDQSALQSIEEVESLYQAKLFTIEEKHGETIKQLKSDYEMSIQKLKEGNKIDTVSKDAMDEMEQMTNKLRVQLETIQKTSEEEKVTLRKAMESHVDTLTVQFKERVESVRTKGVEEVSALQKSIQEKDGKLKQLIDKLTSLTATSTKLRDENVATKNKLESEMNTQKELRGQLSLMKKQLDETVVNSSATATALLKQQESLEKEKSNLENQMKKLRMDLQAKTNKVEELSGKLNALSDNLNAITKGQKAMDEKLGHASKQEAKLQASEMEVNDLREHINKLKLERTKYVTTIEKLQADKDTNERNHGQRTAIVGMLETQLSEMSDKYSDANAKLEAVMYDLNQKSEVLQGDAERIGFLEKELNDAKVAAKRITESLALTQKSNDAKANKMIETLQKELQATKQQMVRKSTAAQQLLQQRETECTELRKTNQTLQNEVDKGSYSDRRIFELAAQQSSRESYQVSEIEVRDSIIDRLKEALLDRDGDLASAEKHAHEVECQIEELFRIRRREDVNIDYLKSIVVQYLSLPPGSTERAGLLPVLATLLQFDEGDYRIIEDGKNKVSWWGSSVVPKLINAPTTNTTGGAANGSRTHLPALSGSAEVSISSNSSVTTAKRTSLQF